MDVTGVGGGIMGNNGVREERGTECAQRSSRGFSLIGWETGLG